MDYPTYDAFHQALVEYLNEEKDLYEADIEARKALSDEEKEERGYIIQNAVISPDRDVVFPIVKFDVSVNNTKFRPGDKVIITSSRYSKPYEGQVIENNFESVYISCPTPLPSDVPYTISVNEAVLIEIIIELMMQIGEGFPGAYFIKELAGLEEPELIGYGAFSEDKIVRRGPPLNEGQDAACQTVIKRPSLYCIQGPPGTGKTDVLSTLAETFSMQNKDVLIISNTHQAVNNALNKIISKNCLLPVTKIGEELKAMEIDEHIMLARTFRDYIGTRKKAKRNKTGGDIVGMTFYGAAINLGLRRGSFQPALILVDEAGQMPFVEGATIGAFGSGSIIFIGDDKQMPPIFHESLANHPFSKSIFSYICDKYPSLKARLQVTYRMNDEITEVVSKNYYEPYGEKLIASDFSKDRRLVLDSQYDDKRITDILSSTDSLHRLNVSSRTDYEDENIEEALFISDLIHEALLAGMSVKDIAVITPFRRQARAVRECVKNKDGDNTPLIDTVERLQGQDVDLIIISFCVSSESYFKSLHDFLLDKNRLNVMISRAKKKVVVLASDVFGNELPF